MSARSARGGRKKDVCGDDDDDDDDELLADESNNTNRVDGEYIEEEEASKAVAEIVASALQTAPLRSMPGYSAERQAALSLGSSALADATRHLGDDTRGRAAERQAELRRLELMVGNDAAEAGDSTADVTGGTDSSGSLKSPYNTPRRLRKHSLYDQFWGGGGGKQSIDPGAVIEEARRLGVRLSKADCDEALEKAEPDELLLSEPEPEFALLPLVLEACRAPLPGGWRRPSTRTARWCTSRRRPRTRCRRHPLGGAFEEMVRLGRKRAKRPLLGPAAAGWARSGCALCPRGYATLRCAGCSSATTRATPTFTTFTRATWPRTSPTSSRSATRRRSTLPRTPRKRGR